MAHVSALCEPPPEVDARHPDAAVEGASLCRERPTTMLGSLLHRYALSPPELAIEPLTFNGVSGLDVYNPSVPFMHHGVEHLPARVEERADETGSQVVIFERNGEAYYPDGEIPSLPNHQDPSVATIRRQKVLTGVEVWPSPDKPETTDYKTNFYLFDNGSGRLEKIAESPQGFKGIRLVDLHEGRGIGITFRGQDGRVYFTTIRSLQGLDGYDFLDLDRALPVIKFGKGEWGNLNHLRLLDGHLGCIGHIARFSDTKGPSGENGSSKEYFPFSAVFDYRSGETSDMQLLAVRSDLPDVPCKREELQHVVYPGGFRNNGSVGYLYAGVGDTTSCRIRMRNPFAASGSGRQPPGFS